MPECLLRRADGDAPAMDSGVMGNVTCSDMPAHGAGWALRSAAPADVEVIARLRATVMRAEPTG